MSEQVTDLEKQITDLRAQLDEAVKALESIARLPKLDHLSIYQQFSAASITADTALIRIKGIPPKPPIKES